MFEFILYAALNISAKLIKNFDIEYSRLFENST